MRVPCEVELTEVDNERGFPVDGLIVTCSRCEKTAQSFGQGESSLKRCFALLKEGCDENNFYYNDAEDD
jgi:hypothetical protein